MPGILASSKMNHVVVVAVSLNGWPDARTRLPCVSFPSLPKSAPAEGEEKNKGESQGVEGRKSHSSLPVVCARAAVCPIRIKRYSRVGQQPERPN